MAFSDKLQQLFRNQKFRRMAIIVGVALVIGWGFTLMGRNNSANQGIGGMRAVGQELVEKSKDSVMTDSPLKEEESYKNMEKKAKEAEQSGGTSVNLRQMRETPMISARIPSVETKNEDKNTFTRLPTQIQRPQSQPQQAVQPKERDQALEQRVAQVIGQSGTLSWGTPGTVQAGGYQAYLKKKADEEKRVEELKKNTEQKEVAKNAVLPDSGITPGEILYAVTDTASNSDQGSTPVMATIITGKWRGGNCLGSFTRFEEKLVVQFSKLVYKGKTYGINGYAIDPKTSLPGVRSSVDTHFLERWGGLVASSFLQGFGQAISSQGSTQVNALGGTTTWHPRMNVRDQVWTAMGVVGEKSGKQFEKMFDMPPTVTLNAGTEIGILVL